MIFVFLLLLFLGVLVEGTITTVPVVLDLLIIFYLFKKEISVFLVAFVLGILLDIALGNNIGKASLIFVVTIFIIDLYERKFEIVTMPFVAISSFLASLIFLSIYGFSVLFPAITASILSLFLFYGLQKIAGKRSILYG